jgi:hypothetical protein
MDVLAHMLWAGIGVAAARRRWPVTRAQAAATIAAAAAPDLIQSAPLLAWIVAGGGNASVLFHYAIATPGTEPAMPQTVAYVAHHLHCALHSAVVALVVSIAALAATRAAWLPLAGWWSHIVIDVFTHSSGFYPVPVLYPLTYRGFDGIAWNEPWFLALNYAMLFTAAVLLYITRAGRNANERRK